MNEQYSTVKNIPQGELYFVTKYRLIIDRFKGDIYDEFVRLKTVIPCFGAFKLREINSFIA